MQVFAGLVYKSQVFVTAFRTLDAARYKKIQQSTLRDCFVILDCKQFSSHRSREISKIQSASTSTSKTNVHQQLECALWGERQNCNSKGKVALYDIILYANRCTKCHGNTISRFHLIVHYVSAGECSVTPAAFRHNFYPQAMTARNALLYKT